MSFFISLSSGPTELLRTVQSILKRRGIELRNAAAADFHREQLASTRQEIEQATAVILVTDVARDSSTRLRASTLDVLADNALAYKPVILIATGGVQGQTLTLERLFQPALLRLGAPTIAARVHLEIQASPSSEVERELTAALDLVLRGILLRRKSSAPILGMA